MTTSIEAGKRSVKRLRVDGGEEDAQEPTYVEDKDIWMDDGNIIISGGTNPAHLFKCHKSILSKNSPVFSEMFGIELTGNVYQGLPVVPLPDAAEDVRALLKTLYEPMYIYVSCLLDQV